MATSMLRLRCCCPALSVSITQIRNGYIVLLPEIPKEEPETNSLFRVGSKPQFSQLTPEKCANGIGSLVVQLETGLYKLEEELQDFQSSARDFSSVIEALEKMSAPLDYAWSTVKNMYMLQHTKELSRVYTSLHPRVQKARAARFQSLPIYNAMKRIDQKDLNEFQKRIVRKYLLEGRLNGLDLSGHRNEHFQNTVKTIEKEKKRYIHNVKVATDRFAHVVTDYSLVKDFPEVVLRYMAYDSKNPTRGPWRVTLQPSVYHNFMKFCKDSQLRWNVWRAYNTRASALSDNEINNSVIMEEIRFQRREQAKLLGFATYAELSMETKMAGNVENVQSMLTSLLVKSKPVLEKDLAELQEFSAGQGFGAELEIWDVPYWRAKQKQHLYGVEEEELRRYFPLPTVLNGLFKLCHHLFGVTIKDATSVVEVWDNDVSYFEVYDENNMQVGSFYLDPYIRNQKSFTTASIEAGMSRCDAIGLKPAAYLIFNFQPPMHGLPSLLSFENVAALFHKFGSALQHLLTKVPYAESSGLTNVEWDAVDVSGHFITYWLGNPETLQSISCHHETNQQLSQDTCSKIIKAQRHMSSLDLVHELYLGAFDLEVYSSKDFWLDITRRLWTEYMPLKQHQGEAHPCSFSQIFCEDYHAAYYSFKWAEMIAADAFSAFQETGFKSSDEIAAKGRRFRDTFLHLGGGCHPSQVFRQFRGRDPSPEALLKIYGVQE